MDKIKCPVAAQVDRDPSLPYVVTESSVETYGEFNTRVSSHRAQLSQQGVSENTRVAIMAETSIEYVACLFAIWRIRAVACPISPRLPATQVKEMIALAGCTHVWDPAGKLPSRTPKAVRRLIIEQSNKNETDDRAAEWQPDRPATIIFTSGSSGYPKAAVHSLGNHCFNALGSNENIPVVPGDRWLLSLPLYHVGGLAILFRTAIAGASIVMPDPEDNTADVIGNANVTHVSMVSTQLYRLLAQPDSLPKLDGMKAILMGGSAIPRHLTEHGWQAGLPLYLSYGLTEMCSQVTTSGGEHYYSSGRPLKYREVKIADDSEILVRGETLFLGYIDGGEITPAVDSDGWFHTGDMGEFDPDGNLHVVGRRDNMFISGGENIYPEEIEAALLEIDEVVEAIVVPVKNPEFGYRPVAFVRTEPIRNITADDLPGLSSFKIPIQFYDWPRKYETGGIKLRDVDRQRRRVIKLDRRHFHKLVKDMYEHF